MPNQELTVYDEAQIPAKLKEWKLEEWYLDDGWLRIKSGSFFGPWLIHAAANVTTCLSVAGRTG